MRIQKEAPKAEPKDILSIDLNFKDIALASKEGVKKVRTSVLKKALSHKLLMERYSEG